MDHRPWLASYPEGVPETIDPGRYRSIADLCWSACAHNGGRIAFSNLGTDLSFADFERLSRDFAAYLNVELKLRKGDRVAVPEKRLNFGSSPSVLHE